jgi:hypothetical protein
MRFCAANKASRAFGIGLAILALVGASAAARTSFTNFVVAGAAQGNGGGFGNNAYVSCYQCKLYLYSDQTGKLKLLGPFSDDASLSPFVYVPGTLSYDVGNSAITFLGASDFNNLADTSAIYTIDSRTGHTVLKRQWDTKNLGPLGTMISTRP